jgi:anti-sigma regulatory factor (Ser/Thr protein kinase)
LSVPLATLLPAELPVVDGLRLSASYVPGAAHAGGGDFYDAFFLDDDRIAIAIGDAAGHGAGAIATMNVARQAIRNAFFDGARPADVLRRANRAVLRSESPAIVTTVVGIIDPATLQFRYACAGHAPPIMATADGEFAPLPAPPTTIPLGAMPHHVTSEQSVTLPVDSLVALYTDGCVDLDHDTDAGTRAFGEALSEARTLKPNKAAAAIDRAIFGTRERADDAAILTIAPEPTLAHLDVKLPADPQSAPLARNALRRFFAATPLDERRTYDALVAVGEAVSNVIEHAYEGRPHQTFEIHARSEGDACTVFVEDAGVWHDDGGEPSGRGVMMMRQLSDDCQIERGARGSRVILRFAFAPSIADVALRIPLN